ncbi:MAG: pilus assembly protein [Chloroflexia bacterium]|nr:pilus assembly protein [Chloroflexia bacterium]
MNRRLGHAVSHAALRGQVIIMFALMSSALIGMLGLSIDGGVYFYARRSAQAAADAGALAGARQVALGTAAQSDVAMLVAGNQFASATLSVASCTYVNDANADVSANCGTAPANATGVRVETAVTMPTFFIRAVPGAPTSVVARGEAVARVQRAGGIPTDSPFIVCGFNAMDVTGAPNGNSGPATNILTSSDPFVVNPGAVGRIFRIHDSNLGDSDCNAPSNSFKGLADQDKNGGRTVPGFLYYDTGTKAGPTRSNVNGAGGCADKTAEPYNCIMLVPVAANDPPPNKKTNEIYVVGFLAFEITEPKANVHNGRLLGAYSVSGPGTDGWVRGEAGIVSVHLTR